jgi:hypothetical protein
MISPSYCGDFEGGCPGWCEPCRHVDEAEETLSPRGETIIANQYRFAGFVHSMPIRIMCS